MTHDSSTAPTYAQPLSAVLFHWAKTNPDAPAVYLPQGEEVRRRTWRELAADVWRMIAHLDQLGVRQGDRVVLWSDNRYEWIVIDLAIQSLGAVNVPLHGSLPAPAAAAQVAHAEPVLVIAANARMIDALRAELTSRGAPIQATDRIDDDRDAESLMARVAQLSADRGRKLAEQGAAAFDPHAIATILYSSGTTGEPKGVALTHANLISNARAVVEVLGETPHERRLNFLPLSHIYARTCDFYAWLAGGSQLVLSRSRDTVLADCRLTRPTLMNAVPYFYQRLAQKVAESENTSAPVTLQELLGGAIRGCICGGAPLPVDLFDFYHERGLPLLPGYGLTESSPVIAVGTWGAVKRGAVGKLIPGIEVRIAADGEVLTRGPHVMREYWKDAALTRETIRDGWLHTGDLGSLDADGFLSITGRKKDLIVLATGKKATPTHIEGILLREPLIMQAMVIGNGQCYLSALVTPHGDVLGSWLAAEGLPELDPKQAVLHPAVIALYRRRIGGLMAGLPACEQVKRFVLLDRPFTIEEGLLTPKLSLRRDTIERTFQTEIVALYDGGGVSIEEGMCATAGTAQ